MVKLQISRTISSSKNGSTVLHAELIKLITVAHNHILNETKTIKQPIHA
jgi:hypothetical protein